MKVKGEYMGKKRWDDFRSNRKEQNKRLLTQQKERPFKSWTSIQEFNQSDGGQGTTHIIHVIDFELQTTGKVANFLSGDQAKNKIQQCLQQSAQTVKQKLESA